jgi:hypothetical protein
MAAAHPLIDRYASPEALSRVASAPLVLCQLIFIVTAGDRRHLAMLRADGKGDSITSEERYAITWVARQFMHVSFPQIGRALSIDHSSAIRGYNRAKLLRMTDHEFRAMTDALAAKMPTRHAVQKRARRIAAR